MLNVPKILNALLGLLTGFAIVIAVSEYLSPPTYQSSCRNIVSRDHVVGQQCTYDEGPILERVELDSDTCFDLVKKQHGAQYAVEACYPEEQWSEKRPL